MGTKKKTDILTRKEGKNTFKTQNSELSQIKFAGSARLFSRQRQLPSILLTSANPHLQTQTKYM